MVAAQLQQWQQDKSIPPEQRKQVMEWLKTEQENKDRNAKIGAFASGGLFIASFIPQLRGISMGLRLAGIGVGGAVAASEIPDLIMLDAAAQAGRGGAGKLTSQSPDEARFNLVMGYANVALAGLDAGLEVGVVQKLAKSTMSVAASGAQVTRQQWSQLIEFAKQGASGGERARALLASIKNLPKQAADEIWSAIDRTVPQPELAGVPKGEIDPKQPMQSTGTTQASGAIPQAIRNYENAATVAPFIGKKFMPGLLPKGYKYAIIPLEDGTTRKVIYLPKSDKTMVPLKIDEATNTIQIGPQGEYRVVRDKYYNANFETIPGKQGTKVFQGKRNSWIHHVVPDNVMRADPLYQRAFELGIFNPDRTSNLIELAANQKALKAGREFLDKNHPGVKVSDFTHYSQHPKYDGLVQEQIKTALGRLKRQQGLTKLNDNEFIMQMKPDELKSVISTVETRMRRGLMGEDVELYKDLKKTTRDNGSLAENSLTSYTDVA